MLSCKDREKFRSTNDREQQVYHLAEIETLRDSARMAGAKINKKPWASMTTDVWHVDYVLLPDTVVRYNVWEGYWLDLEDDYTYTFGQYRDTLEFGYYRYDLDDGILRLYPLLGDRGITEWEVLTNGEMTILVSTGRYGFQGYQIKHYRKRGLPQRPTTSE